MTLSNDIQEAIRKSLPEQTASELKKYLEQAEADKKTIMVLQKKNEDTENRLKEANDERHKLLGYRNKESNLEQREFEVSKREVELIHSQELNKIQALCEREKTIMALDVVRTVFKSQPVGYAFRKEVSESAQEPQGGNYGGTTCTSKNSTETVSQREITE